MNRRHVLKAAAPMLLAAPAILRAQDFNRPLRIIVPNAPGGTSDILARLIGPAMSATLGQPIVVENRAGAGGNIGAELVAKSAPDGHTMLLLDVSSLATNPWFFPRLTFDSARDLAPVSMVIYAPYIMAVNNALPVQDARAFEAYARANPGRINAGNSGTGTLSHLTMIALANAWGTEMVAVPYRGGAPSLTALVANEINVAVAGATQSMPFVVDRQMRGIAVTGPRRLEQLPQLPTFTELGWPMPQAGTWQGLLVAGTTPQPLIAKLEAALRDALAQPAVKARIAQLGAEPRVEGGAAFRTWLAQETETLGKLIRDNKITVE